MTFRRAQLYREVLGIARNPFPDTAIATPADMVAFDPYVHADLPHTMARVFLGAHRQTAHKVSFLWSLGDGNEARGYGKSAYLMWLASAINDDLGNAVLQLLGPRQNNADKVIALYASFSTVDVLSLSGILYATVKDFLTSNGSLILRLRDHFRRREQAEGVLYRSAAAAARAASSEPDHTLLWLLASGGPEDWVEFFMRHTLWHRQRWGRRIFTSLAAFVITLGINRILLLIDQVEDFTGDWSPWRHHRDFGRLADMCVDDRLLSGSLQVVLTQHPRAKFVMEAYWVRDKLGVLPSPDDPDRCVIIPALSVSQLSRLIERRLARVRVAYPDGVAPFTHAAIRRVAHLTGGRPGAAIAMLHTLIEAAVDKQVGTIDRAFVESVLA